MKLFNRLWQNLLEDMLMSGAGTMSTGYRKWYNPWRWIKGKMYVKRIKPDDFWGRE